MSKKKKNIAKIDPTKVGLHVPNEMHVQNFLQGKRMYRNRKKYTRKQKHKDSYFG